MLEVLVASCVLVMSVLSSVACSGFCSVSSRDVTALGR